MILSIASSHLAAIHEPSAMPLMTAASKRKVYGDLNFCHRFGSAIFGIITSIMRGLSSCEYAEIANYLTPPKRGTRFVMLTLTKPNNTRYSAYSRRDFP
jgi:hypothetical protein